MTTILDRAVSKARKLHPEQQDALGAILLEEMETEAAWDRRFEASQDLLGRLADEALTDVAAGRAHDGDPSDRP